MNTGACFLFRALYKVCLMVLSWNSHCSGFTPLHNTVAKANANNPQLLEDCCICTAGVLIPNWGACGWINQDHFCFVCLVMFVFMLSYMQISLGPQKRLLAVIQWLSFMFNTCTNGFCGVPTTPPWWKLWCGWTETHLYEGMSEKCKKKLHPLHRCWAKFVGAGCLTFVLVWSLLLSPIYWLG